MQGVEYPKATPPPRCGRRNRRIHSRCDLCPVRRKLGSMTLIICGCKPSSRCLSKSIAARCVSCAGRLKRSCNRHGGCTDFAGACFLLPSYQPLQDFGSSCCSGETGASSTSRSTSPRSCKVRRPSSASVPRVRRIGVLHTHVVDSCAASRFQLFGFAEPLAPVLC